MRLGLFTMPSHPPERSLADGHDWDLQTLKWADEFGFEEAWIGEHHTSVWEPHPAPDLLVIEGLRQTKNLRIGPGGFLLPYHHPVELANRVSMLDHISRGRLNFGIAASGIPTDWESFQIDGFSGENREMTREAIDIILNIWSQKPGWTYQGKHWKAAVPNPMEPGLHQHLRPFQEPHPPIGVAGLSAPSPTLELAGEHGWIPLSLNLNPGYVKSHWDSVEVGAARTGRAVSRRDWRMVREVFVADTDEEAWRWSVGDMMGRMYREYFLPLLKAFGFAQYMKADGFDVDEQDIDPQYCAEHNWLVGSPETVAHKLAGVYEAIGGFGHLLLFCFDYADNPEPWRRSMELLAHDVMPRVAHLTGE